ncbi:MAG TPA: tetratricopeptide repeat protein [Thermomicrobiales bacterium]|jgi:tetratricopeptide (TPR) repeat protein
MARQKRGKNRESLIPADQLPPLNNETINELVRMLDAGQFVEGILLLEALREEHPREPILYKLLGMAYGEIGDLRSAAQHWEEAQRLDADDASLWRLLAGVYQGQGRIVHALRAIRRYLAEEPDDDERDQIEALRDALDEAMRGLAANYGVSVADAERAGLLLERGLRTMEGGDYLAAQRHFRDAARILPGWVAPLNDLALCQFELGNFDGAIETTERVLGTDPDDVHGRAGLVRYFTALGRRDEALSHADRLWALTERMLARNSAPDDGEPNEFFLFEQAASAFMFLEQDERVIAALEAQPRETVSDNGLILLGAALANVNRKPAALEILREIAPNPVAVRLAEALELNETPPGQRFPAIDPAQLLPQKIAERIDQELSRVAVEVAKNDDPAERLRLMREVLAGAPTFLPAFCASLWMGDELSSANAVGLLLRIGTPEAIEAVRTFAFGRLGPDETRLHAALLLRRDGLVDTNRPLLLWQDGRYQEMSPPHYEISTEDTPPPYAPPIAKLMDKAIDRRSHDDLEGAARAYRQALAQDPTIAEAEQQLGLIALVNNDETQADAHFMRALASDGDSVIARATLASLRISQGRREEARDLLIPLIDRRAFRANDFASYLFTVAELAAAEGEAGRARQQLRLLLAYIPGHTPARIRLRDLEREEAERKQATENPAQGNQGLGLVRGTMGNSPLLGPRG